MVLYKVLNIWDNLEDSYSKLKDSFGVKNRLEFLKKVCGYSNDNTTRLVQLRLRMHKESKSYSPEETDKYNTLIKIFDSLELRIGDISNVSDLESLKSNLINSKDITFSKMDVERILNQKLSMISTIEYTDFYNSYKQFDSVIMDDGSRKEVSILNTANVCKFNSKKDVLALKDNERYNSEFMNACVQYAMKIDKSYVRNTLFILGSDNTETIRFGRTDYKFGDIEELPSGYKCRIAVIKNSSSIVDCRVIQLYK